jgi:hypothetical protein
VYPRLLGIDIHRERDRGVDAVGRHGVHGLAHRGDGRRALAGADHELRPVAVLAAEERAGPSARTPAV